MQGLGWRIGQLTDLQASLTSLSMTRASVILSKRAFPSWLQCHIMPSLTHTSTQAIVEVGLPKELYLDTVDADHQRIFSAYNIWAWVSTIHAMMYVMVNSTLATNQSPKSINIVLFSCGRKASFGLRTRFCTYRGQTHVVDRQVRARLDSMVQWGELILQDDLQGRNRVGTNKRSGLIRI